MIRDMHLGEATPDPSNAYAELPLAAAWGKALFFDGILTPHPRQVSCSACHAPELLFQDAKDQPPEGAGSGQRNVPSMLLATDQRGQFWDGRADSAWAQALAPFEDPAEMASSRLYVVHRVAAHHRDSYNAIFGALPDFSDTTRFPAEGKPGEASWQSMSEADRTTVNRVFANVGLLQLTASTTACARPRTSIPKTPGKHPASLLCISSSGRTPRASRSLGFAQRDRRLRTRRPRACDSCPPAGSGRQRAWPAGRTPLSLR